MTYPGGKSGAGVYHRIINLMPPHDVYIDPFLGGGAILEMKRRAKTSIVIDRVAAVLEPWRGYDDIQCWHGDALEILPGFQPLGQVLVYCDPPYLLSTRKSGPLYRYEMTENDHRRLLEIITRMPCMVMISGYWSEMYAEALDGWNSFKYAAPTRRGPVAETLWFNFPPPTTLHDYRYLGRDFRERERIKRKTRRWIRRFKGLGTLERQAILSAVLAEGGEASGSSTIANCGDTRGSPDLAIPDSPLAGTDDKRSATPAPAPIAENGDAGSGRQT